MSKLYVETFPSHATVKIKKILTCLGNYPEGVTPKVIALNTSINVNTVKSILSKIDGVQKVMRGFYKVVNGGDGTPTTRPSELSDWNFHNCILSCQLKTFPAKLIESTHSFDLINLKFIISRTGHATCRVATDYPLNLASITMVYAFFRELMMRHSDDLIGQTDVHISTIEFNKDYSNLRLDGVQCITLDNFVEQFKVYQKKRGMRIEHKTKIKFTVENVVDMLTNNPNSLELNLKLSAQQEQLTRLTTATVQNTQIMTKIIDNLNKGLDR